ncbi:MAG TPA: RNA 2',3'-cyclic phosphodiesterase [Burkholderiales bacterium]|nr:RNA 2',3'-cyclic phosphodiesterase [Burkholderiales bacterium]
MAAGERARVFFALWPEDAVRAALSAAAVRAQAECAGRATAAARIHLTLFFVGGVARSDLTTLAECAASVAGRPFELATDVLGYWRHNRIVWAGARETPSALTSLVADLTAALAAAGYRGEDRPYAPHVTLVRNARRPPRTADVAAPRWSARDFVLAESAGGRYDVLARWPLRPPV